MNIPFRYLLPLVCWLALSGMGNAQFTTLHVFTGSPPDGAYPQSGLALGSDGNFYGMTDAGGSTLGGGGEGVVFQMTPTGTVTTLHIFTGYPSDGDTPRSAFIEGRGVLAGNYFGMTYSGGANGSGIAFKITSATTYTILHSFDDSHVAHDGWAPLANFIQGSDGNFYGTTYTGGQFGDGTVFNMTPDGTTVTTLHSFGAGPGDGQNPQSTLIEGPAGTFYGTATNGGSAGFGMIFKITTTPSVTISILHTFGDGTVTNDGHYPFAGLTLGVDGNFYGTTSAGGSSSFGTVFRMKPDGTITILHSFAGGLANDGGFPEAGLIQGPDGIFYGTTSSGGTIGGGTIFSITTQGSMTILHDFADPSVPGDGTHPLDALVFGTDGNLYGTTSLGSTFGKGTVFKYKLTVSTDSPTMPVWALVTLALFLCLGAIRFLPKRNLV